MNENLMNLNLSFSGLVLTEQSGDGLENIQGGFCAAVAEARVQPCPGHPAL